MRYNSLVQYKLTPHITLMSKFLVFFLSINSKFTVNKLLTNTLYQDVIKNHYSFYNLFNNNLLGSWSSNLIKSYYLRSLKSLTNSLSDNKFLLQTRTHNKISIHYCNPFKTLSFNISNKIHKRNILFLINYLTNLNSSLINF